MLDDSEDYVMDSDENSYMDDEYKSRYNFSLTTFSPQGRLTQVDYANKCGANGGPAVAICVKRGIVMAADKKPSTRLLVLDTVCKLPKIGSHSVLAGAGLGADFRILSKSLQKSSDMFKITSDHVMPTSEMVMILSLTMQEFTQTCGVRPFGLALLLGGYDHYGPHLFRLDAGGSNKAYKACAVGHASGTRMRFMEKHYRADMNIEVAICLALQALQLDDYRPLSGKNLEMCVIDIEGYEEISPSMIQSYLSSMQ